MGSIVILLNEVTALFMPDEQYIDSPHEGLSKEQKIGFILLLVFAVFSIALGFLQIRNTMYKPFALNHDVPGFYKDEVNGIDALRFRDTDGDGLSDFDELYVYGTSPYLADTNSDGISDKESVDKNINPICPKGRDCSVATAAGEGMPTTFAVVSSSALIGEAPPSLQTMFSNPAEIRKALITAGVPESTLKQISDTDLLAMADQILSSTTTAAAVKSVGEISFPSSSLIKQ